MGCRTCSSTFLGSDLYPYKGILDKLANRSLADGTNAWTATDHTCYTLTSAGQRGMLNMLPIYADHIFYPTLTEARPLPLHAAAPAAPHATHDGRFSIASRVSAPYLTLRVAGGLHDGDPPRDRGGRRQGRRVRRDAGM
jgi:hypothetical protein